MVYSCYFVIIGSKVTFLTVNYYAIVIFSMPKISGGNLGIRDIEKRAGSFTGSRDPGIAIPT